MTVRASSPGNLFLCGEHAVVYGYPAITCSVERRTTVSLTRSDSSTVRIVSDTCGAIEAEITDSGLRTTADNEDLRIFMELISDLPVTSGFDATITSEIPLKSGMSSSTAVLSSFLMACSEEFGLGIRPASYYKKLLPVQRAIHGGKASGSEIYSSSVGGFHYIQRDGDAISAKRIVELDLDIIIADTGVIAPTHLTVGYHIPSLIKRKKGQVYAAFDAIGDITTRMSRALAQGDAPEIGALMNENQEILKALGVSHPKLDDCVNEARNAGALGAKLSGSGWGGVMFALVESDTKEQVRAALESTWARVITTSIGGPGTRLEE